MQQTLSEFLDQAWDEHADRPQAVAKRLPQGFELLRDEPAAASELARLIEHLVLAHLDQPDATRAHMSALQPLAAQDPALALTLQRMGLALALAEHGVGTGLANVQGTLPAIEQVRAHGQAVLALTRRARWAAIDALIGQATAIAQSDPEAKAVRALAILTNNLAGDLRYYRRDGDDSQPERDALMLEAARLARVYWAQAGGWIEVERADYQLALCHAAVGDGASALAHARACLSGCEDNNADAFELFFAREALALSHLAAAQLDEARGQVKLMREHLLAVSDAASLAYAQTCLDKLGARLGTPP